MPLFRGFGSQGYRLLLYAVVVVFRRNTTNLARARCLVVRAQRYSRGLGYRLTHAATWTTMQICNSQGQRDSSRSTQAEQTAESCS
ncbi:hypothetical protein HZ326_21371 [Fusarium oxysporum f. sp. albedinis]|nr:Uncharacterized protein HZ326_24564 [Fusarium oxysporum f. sp. albedinis]KAJ0135608.1 hypothetical protein HZ326_21371 [Fusarium oxysporum f. sp. albedinis]